MWIERFNLGPDREPPEDQRTESATPQEPETPPAIDYRYDGYYEQLFEFTLYMDVLKQDGERLPIGIRLTVPDFNAGALCETLHWNGITYQCAELEPPGEENDDDES